MIEVRKPVFGHKRFLKTGMLMTMSNYPRYALEVFSEQLSDGIVGGFSHTVEKDVITVSKGIIKHHGEIYLIENDTILNYEPTNDTVFIKLTFHDEVTREDYITQYIEIDLSNDKEILENQYELGRFKLKPGAYLRSVYQDLYDFTTEYNTIITVFNRYAGREKPTVSLDMMRYFAREVLQHTGDVFDTQFAFLCLNSDRVERQVIEHYIAYKKNEETKDLNNGEIHSKLVQVLDEIKRGSKRKTRKPMKDRKIIMDY